MTKNNLNLTMNNFQIVLFENKNTKQSNCTSFLFIIELKDSKTKYFALYSHQLQIKKQFINYLLKINHETNEAQIFKHIYLDVLPITHLPLKYIEKEFVKFLPSNIIIKENLQNETYIQKKIRLVNAFGSAKGKRIMHNRLEGMSAASFSELSNEDAQLLDITLNESITNSSYNLHNSANSSVLDSNQQNSSILSDDNQNFNSTINNLTSSTSNSNNFYIKLNNSSMALKDLVDFNEIIPHEILGKVTFNSIEDVNSTNFFTKNDSFTLPKIIHESYNAIITSKNDPKNLPDQFQTKNQQLKLLIFAFILLNFALNQKKLIKSRSKMSMVQLIQSMSPCHLLSQSITGHYILIEYIIKKHTIDLASKTQINSTLDSDLLINLNGIFHVDFGSRAMPPRMHDRLICHICAILLTLNSYKINFADLCSSLGPIIDQNKLLTLVKIMRCHVKRPSSKFIGILPTMIIWKFPLASICINSRRRSKSKHS